MSSNPKILIVEDDVVYLNKLRDLLTNNGYQVIEAEDGSIVMEKLLSGQPNLVILDLMLPKVDGFGVLERIRSYPDSKVSGIPVVILSNFSDEKNIAKAVNGKIDYYLIKSQTSFNDVLSKVKGILPIEQAEEGIDLRNIQ